MPPNLVIFKDYTCILSVFRYLDIFYIFRYISYIYIICIYIYIYIYIHTTKYCLHIAFYYVLILFHDVSKQTQS